MSESEEKYCPFMTTSQVVPRGYEGAVVSRPTNVGAVLQTPGAKGGFNPTPSAFLVEVGAKLKTPAGTKGTDPDIPLIADTLPMPCIKSQCMMWCEVRKDCRLAAGPLPTKETE